MSSSPRVPPTHGRTERRYALQAAYYTDPLVLDLVKLLQTLRYRCACRVRISNFQTLSKAAREEFRINAYVLAARTCVSTLGDWCFHRSIGRQDIEWVFERGDPGWKEFQDLMDREGMKLPIFRSKKDRRSPKTGELLEKAFVPLQAADFLAHEIFTIHSRNVSSPILADLETVPGPVTKWEQRDLEHLEQTLGEIVRGEYLPGF